LIFNRKIFFIASVGLLSSFRVKGQKYNGINLILREIYCKKLIFTKNEANRMCIKYKFLCVNEFNSEKNLFYFGQQLRPYFYNNVVVFFSNCWIHIRQNILLIDSNKLFYFIIYLFTFFIIKSIFSRQKKGIQNQIWNWKGFYFFSGISSLQWKMGFHKMEIATKS
jgi:hypothetical protein